MSQSMCILSFQSKSLVSPGFHSTPWLDGQGRNRERSEKRERERELRRELRSQRTALKVDLPSSTRVRTLTESWHLASAKFPTRC